jgi:hypothetical protein
MAVYVMPPDHCAAEAVWLCDNGTVRYDHPFAVNEDAVTAPTGLPIGIGHYVSIGIGTALSKIRSASFQTTTSAESGRSGRRHVQVLVSVATLSPATMPQVSLGTSFCLRDIRRPIR